METQHRKTLIQNQWHHLRTQRRTEQDRYQLPPQLHGVKYGLQPLPSHECTKNNTENMSHHQYKSHPTGTSIHMSEPSTTAVKESTTDTNPTQSLNTMPTTEKVPSPQGQNYSQHTPSQCTHKLTQTKECSIWRGYSREKNRTTPQLPFLTY